MEPTRLSAEQAADIRRRAHEGPREGPQMAAILKRERRELGVTQEQLGRMSRVSRATIAGIETGRQYLTGKLADRLWRGIYKVYQRRAKAAELAGVSSLNALSTLASQEARIAQLEQQVRDLRALYEAGVAEALAHERFETLREKVESGQEDNG